MSSVLLGRYVMAMHRCLFDQIKGRIQPGDIIAFSGKSNFSRLIRLATRSVVSHVGIVRESGNWIDVIESVVFEKDPVSGEDIDGIRCNRMKNRVESYDGFVWWLPLSEKARFNLNQEKMRQFLKITEDKKYDMPQAIRAALDIIEENPFFDLSTYNQEDFDAFFCSELATAALRAGGVIKNINSSEVTPANLCAFKIFADDYYQLKGRRKPLDEYNEIDPEGFGVL